MNTHSNKTQENKSQPVANAVTQKQGDGESTLQFDDNRPEAVAQRKLQQMANNSRQVSQLKAFQGMANNSPQAKQAAQLQKMARNYPTQQRQPIQTKENNTGLPDKLKSGIMSAQSPTIQRADTPLPLVSDKLVNVDLTLTEVMDEVDKYAIQFDQEFQVALKQMTEKDDSITLTVKNLLIRVKNKEIVIPDEFLHIPISQLVAIRAYTEGSYAINTFLMAEKPSESDIKKLKDNREFILNTVIGLSQMPAFKGWVYRGQRVPHALLPRYKTGEVVPFKAFVSTTKSASVLGQFAVEDTETESAMSLKLFSVSGRDVSQIAKDPSEQEVLFAPGTEFQVIENVKVKDKKRLEVTMSETKAVMKEVPPAPDIAEEVNKEKQAKEKLKPKEPESVTVSQIEMIMALDKIGKLPKDVKPDDIPMLYKIFVIDKV